MDSLAHRRKIHGENAEEAAKITCLACGKARWGTKKAMMFHLRHSCIHPDAEKYRKEVVVKK